MSEMSDHPEPGVSTPMIPMNDLARRWKPFAAEIGERIAEFVRSGRAILGPEVAAFEHEFADYCDTDHCVGVANGTDAIEVALRAIGVATGARVATVANAGGYSTAAIEAIGAVPVYVEIDEASLNISPLALERALREERVDAVIATHLYGRMAEVDAIGAICRSRRVRWIEDCAQAHGARISDQRAGTWADAAAFSFYPTKNLGALGDGGAVITASDEIARAARELRQYGWTSKYCAERAGGRNSRLDELQASVLRLFLPHLDSWNERRSAIAARYREAFGEIGLKLPPPSVGSSVWHLFVVRAADREVIRVRLLEAGVQTDIHYPTPDYAQPATPRPVRLAQTEAACSEVFSLPLFPEQSDAEIEAVVAAVRRATRG
jgi:dTDP-4-amino-4,6-dideoxygalactose transaminase